MGYYQRNQQQVCPVWSYRSLFHDKTIVMISHRLATIRYVDHVYFMAQGEIKEHGTHRQLMEPEGQYPGFLQDTGG